jgi:hypothetical protein
VSMCLPGLEPPDREADLLFMTITAREPPKDPDRSKRVVRPVCAGPQPFLRRSEGEVPASGGFQAIATLKNHYLARKDDHHLIPLVAGLTRPKQNHHKVTIA